MLKCQQELITNFQLHVWGTQIASVRACNWFGVFTLNHVLKKCDRKKKWLELHRFLNHTLDYRNEIDVEFVS